MRVYNALDLKKGAKVETKRVSTLTQPLQMLPVKKKDDEWRAWNVDWLEAQGIKSIKANSKKILKNYKLAKGIIDKSDYMVEEENENKDVIQSLLKENTDDAMELKFYPIIPNVINILTGEFSKRNNKVQVKALDSFSKNEMLEEKRTMVESVLIAQAEQKIALQLMEQGIELDSEEAQQAMGEIKSLPEIEQFFKKSYKSMVEQWAGHQLILDDERFKMYELENIAFRDMLITDMEFWHIDLKENDYEVELWNPLLTFFHKSPETRYVSEGNYVGKIEMMSIADVIDTYGYMMDEEQLSSLEEIFPMNSGLYLQDLPNDGSYYDPSKSYSENTRNPPSLGYRKLMSTYDALGTSSGGNAFDELIGGEGSPLMTGNNMLRVTKVYWKSQRKVGHLTKVDEMGNLMQAIVSEAFVVSQPPEYANLISKDKSKDNLVYGEHVDWIWINQVWGGTKIGPNHNTFWQMNNPNGLSPIYLDIKPIKFQFKGDQSLYGCKLPVEGSRFSDRNTRSMSLVDLMKPFQVGYNLVNNQIADILIDELGTVIVLDHNTLPKRSMGEDWGKNNMSKAYVAMKNFQMLPLDTTMANTESALNFQHFQSLDLSQTQRLLSRIQIAEYFKDQAFQTIGITRQRAGDVAASETATGVQQAVNNSYSQTEMYFIQHMNFLMPRVKEMILNAAQYYNSEEPSIQLSYVNSADENVFFEMEGIDLLPRDLHIFPMSKPDARAVLDQLKQLAVNNNTTGSSLFDLASVLQAETPAEVSHALKAAEEKASMQQQQQMQHEQELQDKMTQAQEQQAHQQRIFEAEENQKDREAKLVEAQIKAAGYGGQSDINANQQNDYLDSLKFIQSQKEYENTMGFDREKESNKNALSKQKMEIEKEKLRTQREIANKQLQIAKENKNKYDVKSKTTKKK
jgi:hypothetical protein